MAVLVVISDARADDQRRPYTEKVHHETTLTLSRYETPLVIERVRTNGNTHALFFAEPQLIDRNAILVLEIDSVFEVACAERRINRWRCVVVDDIAECLGTPVRIRYLHQHETLVLTVTAKPRSSIHLDTIFNLAPPALGSGWVPKPSLRYLDPTHWLAGFGVAR